MSKIKYRIIEEKHEHVSHFYAQYLTPRNYILWEDIFGKNIESEYQYFGSFNKKGSWKRDRFYELSQARKRIEMDIQHTTEELKETIVHEY